MKKILDTFPVECVQADLEKINALVDLLRHEAERNSMDVSVYQSEFSSLSLNLMNVFDLILKAREDLTQFIDEAYKAESAEG